MKILVADDNGFYRQLLERTLAEWGYDVLGVDSGHAAWDALRSRNAPHLAIIDWMMPGMTGLELCRQVRSLHRTAPTYLIMLTAKDGRADSLAALHSGADDYICKPFDADELQARLQVGLRIVGLQANLAERVGQLEHALSGVQKIEAMGRLAGGVAHDFNNILTVINGYSDLLLQGIGPGQRHREPIEIIRQAGERGTALTRQLLAFARKQVLNPVVLDLNGCVANVRRLLDRLLGENLRLIADLAPGLYPVEADPGQIEQVLMNLLLNARDAMPAGGTVTVTTANLDHAAHGWMDSDLPPGRYAVLSVADTGCGMDEATRGRIFEPFFTTKEPGKGTGLGLATVYGIVKQSGGHVEVESEPNHGTTFRIYLPRAARAAATEEAEGGPDYPCGRETVLVVEDETWVRLLVNEVLTQAGYRVLDAADGAEAMRIGEQYPGPIQLLLTDIIMPGINGCQLAGRLAPLRPDMKILYMSGYIDAPLTHPYATSDIPFLSKPFTPTGLMARVRETLGVPLALVEA